MSQPPRRDPLRVVGLCPIITIGTFLEIFSLAIWVPCLCSGVSCLLCSCCSTIRIPLELGSSTLLFSSLALMSWIMMTEGIQTQLKKIPEFCEGGFRIKMDDTKAEKDCDMLVHFKAVYQINFAVAIFFFAFFWLMLKVHNRFWFFRNAAIIAIMVGSFYIPGGHFIEVWFSAGILGGAFLIFIQLVLLVDVAHSWNESWVN